MKHVLSLVFFCTVFFMCSVSHAQKQRDHYSLLWKISGNGLKKPSYLFGTMHLYDKRVFDFSDSVLFKLQECEGFALEISPDSMVQTLVQMLMNEQEEDTTEHDLKKDLTEEEYKLLKEKLFSERGLQLEHFKDADPQQIVKLLKSPSTDVARNDKATFLDGYLYRVALGEKKIIYGLENINDHAKVSETEYDNTITELKKIIHASEYNTSFDNLIQTYWEGDIQKINSFTLSTGETWQNSLYTRNHKMVDRIMEIAPEHTTFFAVGAAHLDGEEGLIYLLKQKGYTLTKVSASFTGQAAKYKPKPLDLSWKRFPFEKEGYSVLLPSKPAIYPYKEKIPFNLYMYPDVTTGIYYFSMNVPSPESSSLGEPDQALNAFIERIFKNREYKNVISKNITFNGYEGKEVEAYNFNDKMYARAHFIRKQNHIFFLMTSSYTKELVKSLDAEKFFQSLDFFEVAKTKVSVYSSEDGAYKVDALVELKEFSQDVPTASGIIKTHFMTGVDDDKGISYWVGYYLLPSGMVITEDSSYMSSFAKQMTRRIGIEVAEIESISLNGYSGKSFYMKDENGLTYRTHALLRGSRLYMFFVAGPKEKLNSSNADRFMDSFTFIPFAPSKWTPYVSKDSGLEWMVPSKVNVETDTSYYNKEKICTQTFNTIDANSGLSYVVEITYYSPYYFIPKEKFYKEQRADFVSEGDSVLSEKETQLHGIKAMELLIKVRKTHSLKRVRYFPVNNSVVHCVAWLPQEDACSESANRFFDSFQFTDKKAKTTLFDNKAKMIIEGLSSADSSLQQQSLDILGDYAFQQEDKALVYQALNKSYANDSLDYGSTRSILVRRLEDMEDSTTVSFIQKLYPALQPHPTIQLACLQTLMTLKDSSSKKAFVQLTHESIPLVDDIPYSFFDPLEDSLELNASLYPDLFFLFKSSAFRYAIYVMGETLLDSNKLNKTFFVPYLDSILAYNLSDLPVAENENGLYNVLNSIPLLGYFTEKKEVVDQLTYFTSHTDDMIAFEAVQQLVKHKKQVPPQVLLHFAEQNKYRLLLYRVLKENDQLALYPSKWYNQQYFAEADVYEMMGGYEDEFYYEKLVFVNSKVISYKGTPSRFYLFKAVSEGEAIVGISGPYALDKKIVYSEGEGSKTKYEGLKTRSLNEHYEELLKEEELED